MSFFSHLIRVPEHLLPPQMRPQLEKANTLVESMVMPYRLQSTAAQHTRTGKLHGKIFKAATSHTGMMIVNGVLTYFTFGLYAALVSAAADAYKDRQKRRMTDRLSHLDDATQAKLDSLDAEAERLTRERERIAKGGANDPHFQINPAIGA